MDARIANYFPPRLTALLHRITQAATEVYLVGGALRSAVLGHPMANEINLIVPIPLRDFRRQLHAIGLQVSSCNKNNCLFIPMEGGERPRLIEISTFKQRPNHPFTLEEDLSNRDLSINAIAYKWPDGPFCDPFNGLGDLADKRVRLLNGRATLADDPMSGLRLFRYALMLDAAPNPGDLAAAEECPLGHPQPGIVRAELDRILGAELNHPESRALLIRMFDSQLGKGITQLLGIPAERQIIEQVVNCLLAIPHPDDQLEEFTLMDLRWLAIYTAVGASGSSRPAWSETWTNQVTKYLEAMDFSNRRERRIIETAQELGNPLETSDRWLKRQIAQQVPIEGILRLHLGWLGRTGTQEGEQHTELTTALKRCRELRSQAHRQRNVVPLALSGGEILELVRLPPGPWLGKLQHELQELVVETPTSNNRHALEEYVCRWITHQG